MMNMKRPALPQPFSTIPRRAISGVAAAERVAEEADAR